MFIQPAVVTHTSTLLCLLPELSMTTLPGAPFADQMMAQVVVLVCSAAVVGLIIASFAVAIRRARADSSHMAAIGFAAICKAWISVLM